MSPQATINPKVASVSPLRAWNFIRYSPEVMTPSVEVEHVRYCIAINARLLRLKPPAPTWVYRGAQCRFSSQPRASLPWLKSPLRRRLAASGWRRTAARYGFPPVRPLRFVHRLPTDNRGDNGNVFDGVRFRGVWIVGQHHKIRQFSHRDGMPISGANGPGLKSEPAAE